MPSFICLAISMSIGNAGAGDIYKEYLKRYFPIQIDNVFYSKEFSSPGVLKELKINNYNDTHSYFISAIRFEESMSGRVYENKDVPLDSILTNETLNGIGPEDYTKRFAFSRNYWGQIWSLSNGATEEIKKMAGRQKMMAVRDYAHNYFKIKSIINFNPHLARAVESAQDKSQVDYYPLAMQNMEQASKISLLNISDQELKANATAKLALHEPLPDTVKGIFRDPDAFYKFPEWNKFSHVREFGGGSHFHAFAAMPGKSKSECEQIIKNVLSSQKTGGGYPEMVPGMEFVLIRYAAALGDINVSVRLPIVEEVFYRKFGPYKEFSDRYLDPDSSDFFGGQYKLYQLDRKKFINGDEYYLKEKIDTDTVFYGFSTDVPAGRNRHLLTLRGNCTDCHASDAPTWESVGIIKEASFGEQKLSSGEAKYIEKDQFKILIEYIQQE